MLFSIDERGGRRVGALSLSSSSRRRFGSVGEIDAWCWFEEAWGAGT